MYAEDVLIFVRRFLVVLSAVGLFAPSIGWAIGGCASVTSRAHTLMHPAVPKGHSGALLSAGDMAMSDCGGRADAPPCEQSCTPTGACASGATCAGLLARPATHVSAEPAADREPVACRASNVQSSARAAPDAPPPRA